MFEYFVVKQIVISLASAEYSSARKAATATGGGLSSVIVKPICSQKNFSIEAKSAASKGV